MTSEHDIVNEHATVEYCDACGVQIPELDDDDEYQGMGCPTCFKTHDAIDTAFYEGGKGLGHYQGMVDGLFGEWRNHIDTPGYEFLCDEAVMSLRDFGAVRDGYMTGYREAFAKARALTADQYSRPATAP